ncbi:MAG: DNA polymerase III, subunit gamma and tau [Microbacterium sp. 69-10]|uniref:DNA polymerase III subunit gamma and tau n=1 Tax=Microbacterium sp. 69-10 TaxID=1895783 RepID=UPI00095CDAC6|nr:DNA polymerase III subunit gamma and tau [Microbacterium sp. 69-10]OJU38655.1 MAG: DNA polymerase III, subunit gamma and tau [Microbacterium sp. 69-10]
MTTALYRRYRPETFAEMIGQSQVTDPLMTALRGDRVGHAYLFSGPRGCGKTTSARILARCLNCAEGPTDTPCGVCPSCVELSRNGGGSLDVVEIDAASHNGVDDARDLRERATFAPSRDRYKIFILDEAHMVTPQGFNALLKLVEEPPAHVKFIFATTEPEKVLGTIRSRTHHYPFRLVPPAAMIEYVEKLCVEEGVQVEPGVLGLVVRAGGGSPRDTLSLLDQLIAGSDGGNVTYERAVALLGYTHAALLDEIVEALAAGDAAAAFPAVDRVVQTGQDPRRFVDDLLERLRDLIVIAAVGDGASAVLRGLPADEMQRMVAQAASFGAARLSRTADLVSQALDDMTGATSPRLHLELLVARVLAGAPADAAGQAAAVQSTAPRAVAPAASAPAGAGAASVGSAAGPAAGSAPSSSAASSPAQTGSARAHSDAAASGAAPSAPAAATSASGSAAATPDSDEPDSSTAADAASDGAAATAGTTGTAESEPSDGAAPTSPASESESMTSDPEPEPSTPAGPVTFDRISAAWSAVLDRLASASRSSWLVATGTQPLAYDPDSGVLTLGFASAADVPKFKGTKPGQGPSDHLRTAIEQELGITVKYLPAPLPPSGGGSAPRPAPPAPAPQQPVAGDDAPAAGWANPMSAPESIGDSARGGGSGVGSPAASGGRAPAASASSRSAAAAVTEWAVAPIPTSAPETPAGAVLTAPAPAAPVSTAPTTTVQQQFPVDEEPADAEASASAPQPPVDGAIDSPPEVDYPPFDDAPPYDDEPPYDPAYDGPQDDPRASASYGRGPSAPARAMSAPATPAQAASAPMASAQASSATEPRAAAPVVSRVAPVAGGVERRGEAVIRQVLGARFLREEPYQPPTRFN